MRVVTQLWPFQKAAGPAVEGGSWGKGVKGEPAGAPRGGPSSQYLANFGCHGKNTAGTFRWVGCKQGSEVLH